MRLVLFNRLFIRVDEKFRSDREWVLSLIEKGIFSYEAYQHLPPLLKEDSEICLTLLEKDFDFFTVFNPEMQNTSSIAKSAFNKAKESKGGASHIVKLMTSKELLQSEDDLCLVSVTLGKITYKELNDTRQKNIDFAAAAVFQNYEQWGHLSEEMRENEELLNRLRTAFELAKKTLQPAEHEWHQNILDNVHWFKINGPKMGKPESFYWLFNVALSTERSKDGIFYTSLTSL